MYNIKKISLIIFVISILSCPTYSQTNKEISDFSSALYNYEKFDFKEAFTYIEKFLCQNPNIDEESKIIAYLVAGTSANQLGYFEKSIMYLNYIFNIPNLPDEVKIEIDRTQLSNLSELSLFDECIPILEDLKALYNRSSSLEILYTLIDYFYNIKEYQNALKMENEVLNYNIPNNINDLKDITILTELHGIYMDYAMIYYDLEDWDSSLKYFLKCLETCLDKDQNNKSLFYMKISELYGRKGDKTTSIKYIEYAFNNSKNENFIISNKELNHVIESLQNSCDSNSSKNSFIEGIKKMQYGILLYKNDRYEEALETLEESYKILEITHEYDYKFYLLIWLANVYQGLGNIEKYIDAKKGIKEVLERDQIKDEVIKLKVLSAYGEMLEKDGLLDQALEIAEKSLDLAMEIYGFLNIELYSYYYRLASLYLETGRLNDAKYNIEKAKNLNLENRLDKTDYYSLIILESYLMEESGQIGDMISLLEGIANDIENGDSLLSNKSNLYRAFGLAYSIIGDFDKVELYNEKVIELEKKFFGIKSPYYATALLNHSQTYSMEGQHHKAIEMCSQAIEILENIYGKNNKNYINGLMRLAGSYSNIDADKSKRIYLECSQLWMSLYSENSKEYAESLIWANLDLRLHPSEESLLEVKKGLEILKTVGYDKDQFYIGFLGFYAYMLYFSQQWNDLLPVLRELLDKTKSYVYNNFLVMPANQREILWNTVKHKLDGIEQMTSEYSHYAVENNDFSLIDEYSSLCYDSRLLKKGILLTSSKNIDELLNKINEPRINELRSQISNLINLQLQKDPFDEEFERLNRQINFLERELLSIILESRDFMDFLKIDWQDIQNALWPGEVAIEFFAIPNPLKNYTQYGAVILNDSDKPICLSTFCDFELEDFFDKEDCSYDYNNPNLYKIIWSVIEVFSIVKNAHTIYFSADGILNTINIENLIDENGEFASDKRNLVRLSSTRELIKRNKLISEEDIKNLKYPTIVLYGGLDYDAPLDSSFSTYKKSQNPEIFINSANRSFMSKAESLPGTLKEVNLLSEKFKNANVIQFTGANGTEESVAFITQKNPYLLHIATHGFYYDVNTEDKNKGISNKSNWILNIHDNSLSPETKAMKASGLLFSGANHTLKGEKAVKQNNDGILTAEELSDLKLNEVDLVVLSACETGLGSVSEEGVFGLQRGFKLTGVNSILMTLWKVDDEATQILMQHFYENLINGESKIRSLKLAQEKLRAIPGYEDPEYWAAFILLDALN
ncbi:MAG: CHAT domain-containing protein [Erysipelotrichales bacterium]|nr:CHAT domain-containing protein [Erysipelotrichales bacterium]